MRFVASFLLSLAVVSSSWVLAKDSKIKELKPSSETGLSAAFKREYAFLLSQKRILEEQKTKLALDAEKKQQEARARLASLRAKYLQMTKVNESLNAQFETVQVRSENQGQIFSQLEGMLEQASTTVSKVSKTSEAEKAPLAEQLSSVFTQAKMKLSSMASIQTEEGSFFLPSGEKVTGTITSVGGIAAFGKADKFEGALMPAGEGLFKARPELALKNPTAETVASLNTLPLFIFEDTSKEVVEAKAPGVFETVESGGSIAWIIVGLGLISLLVVGLRAVRLKALGAFDSKKLVAFENMIADGEVGKAKDLASTAPGSLGRLLQVGTANFGTSSAQLEDALTEVISVEQVKIERFGTMVLVFASVAPLMGLLGTVTGMISTFDIITQFGTGDPKMLSGGISEALITTELGLVVAIPSLLLGNFLSGWATQIQNQMENFAMRLMNLRDKAQ